MYSSTRRQKLAQSLQGNYVYLDWGGGFSRFHSRRFGEGSVPVLQTNMNDMASDYLAARGGACYLPSSLKKPLAGMGLWPVSDAPEFSRQLNVAYHSGNGQRELLDNVANYFRGLVI